MIDLYGIPNCDTVKKAVSWLKQHELEYRFHDYKKEGVSKARLKQWCKVFGWENVLNKQGTTWKQLSIEGQSAINNEQSAINFLAEHTSAIRRPVVEADGKFLLRFNADAYEGTLLKQST